MTKLSKRIVLLTVIIASIGHKSISSEQLSNERGAFAKKVKYTNRRLLVRYKDQTSYLKKEEVHFSVGAYVVKSFDIPKNLEVVEVQKGISLDAAQEFFKED